MNEKLSPNLIMNRIKLNWTNITLILLLILVVTLLVTQFNKRPFQTNKNVIWMERSTSEKATDNLDIDFDFSKLNDAFVKLAKNLSPSVVNIYTSTKFESPNRQRDFRAPDDELFRHFFGPLFNLDQQFPFILPKESTTLGSGFIINENGVLITNSHIIRNMGQVANKIMIKFKGQKGKGFPASVVGLDVSTDIAVLKLEKAPAKVKPVYLGHSKDIQVGEWVMAIGNPFGHSNTVTVGIVSALGRELHSLESRNDFIQTSANINPGNSGGPLFNMKGEVIGINAAIDPRAQAIGFAIPIDLSKNVITQLIEKGEVTRGWLGIEITDITTEIKELLKVPVTTGVVVLSVGKGTPAENSGIKVYDVIVAIDDKKIATARELSQEIAHTKPGKIIDINLYRESNKKKIKVMVGKTTEQQKLESRVLSSTKEDKEFESDLGIEFSGLNNTIRERFNIDANVSGIVVTRVVPFSLASQMGFTMGDVVIEVNKENVKNSKNLLDKIEKAKKEGDKLLFRVLKQNGYNQLIVLNTKSMN